MYQNAKANQIAGFLKVQYSKKDFRDQVDFLYVNKHQSLLQGDIITLAGWLGKPKVPKIGSCD